MAMILFPIPTSRVFAVDGDFLLSSFAPDADVAIHEPQCQILAVIRPTATRNSSAHLPGRMPRGSHGVCFSFDVTCALWLRTSKNWDVSIGPLAQCSFLCFARTTHSFACCALLALLTHSAAFKCSFAYLLPHLLTSKLVGE